MQFKLFTLAAAALTAGLATAGPVPAPVEARDVNQAQFVNEYNQINQALGTNAPNREQYTQIQLEVQNAHQAHWSDWQPWNRYDDYYDSNYITQYYPYYTWLAWYYQQACPWNGYTYTCQAYSYYPW